MLHVMIKPITDEKRSEMPRFVIECRIPKAGQLTSEQLQTISQKSCSVLTELGPQAQWVQSYVTDDIIFCTYIAPDQESVREHARRGGFPANKITAVAAIINPTTAEE